jgi:hypothetical protein
VLRTRLDQGRAEFVAEVARIHRKTGAVVVIDRKGPAESLERDLVEAGVRIAWAGLDDYVGACADLYDAVETKQVTHGDYDDLNDAVGNAEQRRVGDRWAWSRRNGDVSMLEAVTLALWGANHKPPTEAWGFLS